MSANTPEGKVKAKIDAILKPYKTSGRLWYTKMAGSMFGKNGVPDYVCNLRLDTFNAGEAFSDSTELRTHIFFTIEAKAGAGKPSDLQLGQMKDIERSGGICFVINEKNLDILEAWLRAHS
jgi:hypothetical protein